jgi:hypothetical protein
MIRATTAITIKIPKPMPALNIPVTTLQEENNKEISCNMQTEYSVGVFMVYRDNYYRTYKK